MFEEPHNYVENILKFKQLSKDRRKKLIEDVKQEISFLEKVISGRIKVRETEIGDPDFNVRLKYQKQSLLLELEKRIKNYPPN